MPGFSGTQDINNSKFLFSRFFGEKTLLHLVTAREQPMDLLARSYFLCFCCFPTRSLIYTERRSVAQCILFTERGQPMLSSFAKPQFRSLIITKGYLRKILADYCISNLIKKACRHHHLGGGAVLLPLVPPCGPQLAYW